ncbi:MAG: ABC-F family ATP-binding cassette domain-containing protein [Candidatus Nucleicultricaceae bacterium]
MSLLRINLENIKITFGGRPLFEKINLSLASGDRACLVGRNGSGKSTLLKVIAGDIEPDEGTLFKQPRESIAYLPQEPVLNPELTALEYALSALPEDERDQAYRGEALLQILDVDPNRRLISLSGGEARRIDIARALILEPSILLLDEPTNHLDLRTILWLEDWLRSYQGSLLMISHDRSFLEAVTNKVFWLDRGIVRTLNKGYTHFQEWSDTIREQEAVAEHKLDRLIDAETTWSHQGITARRKRNQGRLNRLYSLRQQRSEQIKVLGKPTMQAVASNLKSELVIEAENITKAYGDRVIIKPFSTRIVKGDRIGIVGPNGAGKTTLIKMLTGELKPDSGYLRLGKNLDMIYLDQKRDFLKGEATVAENLVEGGGDMVWVQGQQKHVIGYLKDFLFTPIQARSPVKSLSGGERNRLMLAKALAQPSNFLVLDEPTNDLDMDTLDLLQEILDDYQGTILIVSHDRSFLDTLVTSTIALEGDGTVTEYAGGYTDYLTQRQGHKITQKVSAVKNPTSRDDKKMISPDAGKESAEKKCVTKLSYKQARLLNDFPMLSQKNEDAIKALEVLLEDPEFYTKDPEHFKKTTEALSQLQEQQRKLEEEWLEVTLLHEEIEQSKR